MDRIREQRLGRGGGGRRHVQEVKSKKQATEDLALAQLFRRDFKPIGIASVNGGFPLSTAPEIAFAGRSNVGKSSLLNELCGASAAPTSPRPGETQQLAFYRLGKLGAVLVDLPGYGFAYAVESSREAWNQLIEQYAQERKQLMRLFVLLDARHGIKERDRYFFDFLDASKTRYQVVLTKCDLVPPADLETCYQDVRREVANRRAVRDVLMVSSRTGAGIDPLRRVILHLVRPPPPPRPRERDDAAFSSRERGDPVEWVGLPPPRAPTRDRRPDRRPDRDGRPPRMAARRDDRPERTGERRASATRAPQPRRFSHEERTPLRSRR